MVGLGSWQSLEPSVFSTQEAHVPSPERVQVPCMDTALLPLPAGKLFSTYCKMRRRGHCPSNSCHHLLAAFTLECSQERRAICSLDELFWVVVAAIIVHPSSCCYTRTGFRLGHGQGSCSADPGSGCNHNVSLPFLSALSHPLFSTFGHSMLLPGYSSRPSLLYPSMPACCIFCITFLLSSV